MRTHSYGFAYILIDINELPRRSWPVVQTSEDANWATQQNMPHLTILPCQLSMKFERSNLSKILDTDEIT